MNKYRYTKRKKYERRRFFAGITILIFIIAVIVGVQLAINKRNVNNTAAAAEDSTTDSEKEKSLVASGLNMSEDSLQYADSGEFVQSVINNTYERDGKKIAYLTFDDGPSADVTPKILDVLKEKDARATFFILGSNVKENVYDILKREVKEGHALGNHSYSHQYKNLYDMSTRNVKDDNVLEEYQKTNDKIREVLGDDFDTKVFRFPGGLMSWKNTSGIKEKFKEKGISYIDWNALDGDAESSKKKTPSELLARLKETTKGKEKVVILMHDIKENTAEALPDIIDYLKSEGYEFRTIK